MRPPRPRDLRQVAGRTPGGLTPSQPAGVPASVERQTPVDQYGSFRASLLYCPKCRQATPTRERLLLVLPTGNLYEYLCMACGTSTGSKTDQERADIRLVIP
jgi:hypothetical protein